MEPQHLRCPECGTELTVAGGTATRRGQAATADPGNPYAAPAAVALGSTGTASWEVRREAERLMQEKQCRRTAIELLVTGIIGCFSPILVIYGLVFLLRRPQPFPGKGMAVAGTLLHGFWTALLALYIFAIVVASQQR